MLVFMWYKVFQDGRVIFEDMSRSRRPSTCLAYENIKNVIKMGLENRHGNVLGIAEFSAGKFHRIETFA